MNNLFRRFGCFGAHISSATWHWI